MGSFVKLDTGILNSSLWPDRDIRDLFITALLMAEPYEVREEEPQVHVRTLEETGWKVKPGWYGFVRAAGVGIIRMAGIEKEIGLDALEILGSPETDSRSTEYDGRRLVRVNGGYIVLNYIKYRERDYSAAERMQRWRDRQKEKPVTVVVTGKRHVTRNITQAEAEADPEGEDPDVGDPEAPPPRTPPVRVVTPPRAAPAATPPTPAPAKEPPPLAYAAPAALPQGLSPFRPPLRPIPVGAVTLDFLDCFDRYPNKNGKHDAAVVWQEIAAQYPGGESVLKAEILAAFDAGLLERHPYKGEAKFRPKFETFLAKLRWLDPVSKPDDAPARDVKYGHAGVSKNAIAGDRTANLRKLISK